MTSHENSCPPSAVLTTAVFVLVEIKRAGLSHDVLVLIAFFHCPGLQVRVFPGITSPVSAGSTIGVGGVLFTAVDANSTSLIPF